MSCNSHSDITSKAVIILICEINIWLIHVDIKTVCIPHDPTVFFILAPGLKVHEGHWDTTAVNQKRSIDSLREINNYLDRIRKR